MEHNLNHRTTTYRFSCLCLPIDRVMHDQNQWIPFPTPLLRSIVVQKNLYLY